MYNSIEVKSNDVRLEIEIKLKWAMLWKPRWWAMVLLIKLAQWIAPFGLRFKYAKLPCREPIYWHIPEPSESEIAAVSKNFEKYIPRKPRKVNF